MKIDFIISNLGGDGAQRVVSTLANYFAEKGNIVRIITYREGDKYELHHAIERVRLHKKLPFLDSNLMRATIHLLRFYRKKKNRPDIISSHINTMGLVTIPISVIYGMKLIVSEHNNHLATKMTIKKWWLWNVLYKFPDAVTILTSFDTKYFSDKNKKVVVMPNPLSFPANRGSIARDDKTIVVCGNLNRYHHKGLDNLIEIVASVAEKCNDWKFMVVGEGDKGLSFLQEKVEQLKVKNNIEFAGYRNDIRKILQTSEIFMLCSRYEGLPMVLMEAASQGIACIAYDCISGPSEIIDDGVTGILVENQNSAEMAEKTISLIEDSELRKKLGDNAVRSIEKFSLDRIGNRWQKLFEDVLS